MTLTMHKQACSRQIQSPGLLKASVGITHSLIVQFQHAVKHALLSVGLAAAGTSAEPTMKVLTDSQQRSGSSKQQ